MAKTFTTNAASEWGVGIGVNGTGRRARVHGFYVVDTRTSRAVRAFTGSDAAVQAAAWAERLDEMLAAGSIR